MTDFYEALGVSQDATPEEIKRAYRKLARTHHPDIAGEDGAERFKEVTAAYDVLSDPEKRRQYDAGGSGGFGGGAEGFSMEDLFTTFGFGGAGGGSRGPASRMRRGQDGLLRVQVELSEVVFGAEREMQVETAVVCGTCQGSCTAPGTEPQMCRVCSGRGSIQRQVRSIFGNVLTQARCDACQGFGSTIPEPCPECSGEGRVRTRGTLKIVIPPGIESGQRLKLMGQGEAGPGGGPAGDVYVEIQEKTHPVFTRRGDDLHCTVSLPMTAAALGTVLSLESLDGAEEVDIAPGTQADQVVTLRGKGVGKFRRSGRGDLHLHLDVQVPTKLDDRQEALLRELAALRGEERPATTLAPVGAGRFSRLRDKLAGR